MWLPGPQRFGQRHCPRQMRASYERVSTYGCDLDLSRISFTLIKRATCVFAITQSSGFSSGGMRQKERTRFSTVSFVPEPSGSNKYLQVPPRELDDLSVMRWFGTSSVKTSKPL
jgi:hypothetical protein